MSTEIIEAHERSALAHGAWVEAQDILDLMVQVATDHDLNALRGMAMRCNDLVEVMAQSFADELMKVEEAWEFMYGRAHDEWRAEYTRRKKAEQEAGEGPAP